MYKTYLNALYVNFSQLNSSRGIIDALVNITKETEKIQVTETAIASIAAGSVLPDAMKDMEVSHTIHQDVPPW